MKRTIFFAAVFLSFLGLMRSRAQNMQNNGNMEKLKLTEEWGKTFLKSDKVDHSKVTFVNRFGITLATDLYVPKIAIADKFSAVVVSDPFGTMKEQSSGLYAQALAERGFLTTAFDPSFTGESSGQPRSVTSPDINMGDFSATADYLTTRPDVGAEHIGILGICGWGGFTINAVASDARVKATVASIMYDISRANANGYFDAASNTDTCYRIRRELNAQRVKDYCTGTYPYTTTNPEPAEDVLQLAKDCYDYHKAKRGYHSRSVNSGLRWDQTSTLAFIDTPILVYSDEIRSAVLLIHGEKAHSRYFNEDAFKKLKDDNKELMVIPGIVHTDLYDRMDIIPFNRMELFLEEHLK